MYSRYSSCLACNQPVFNHWHHLWFPEQVRINFWVPGIRSNHKRQCVWLQNKQIKKFKSSGWGGLERSKSWLGAWLTCTPKFSHPHWIGLQILLGIISWAQARSKLRTTRWCSKRKKKTHKMWLELFRVLKCIEVIVQ